MVPHPMDMADVARIRKAFAEAHSLCEHPLHLLRHFEMLQKEMVASLTPASKEWDQARASLYRIQATIRRKEPDPNKWPK